MPGAQADSSTLQFAFLDSFRVAEGVFDLGGKVAPGSIRDQVMRTRLFVAQLREHGSLSDGKKVCILGAGPAGMTAAIQISYLPNVKSWLVDRNSKPLSLLAKAAHRHISPTLYDWPAAHFSSHQYSGIPAYCEGSPSLVRERWLYEFENAKIRGLEWIHQVDAVPHIDEPGPPWRVDLTPKPISSVPERFDLVILCRGFGKERGVPIKSKNNGTFDQFTFWAPDPYPLEKKRSLPAWKNLAHTSFDCAVVVLGGGDGAIQDMLRFITEGRDTRSILDEIEPLISPRITTELARITGQMENEARYRAFARPSAQLSEDLESAINALIERIATQATSDNLQRMIRCSSIRMYFKDAALGPCYPLNRFLALLFRWCIKKSTGRDILFSKHTVSSIACSHAGDDHFDQDHEVLFAPPNDKEGVRCRVVVPRLGIDPKTVPSERTFALHHALPYWLDDWKPIRA